MHEYALLSCGIRAVSGKNCPAEKRTRKRQDDTDVYESGAPWANDRFQNSCHLWVFERGEFFRRENAHAQNRDEHIDDEDTQKARQRGFADIGGTLGARGKNHSAFNADERPDRGRGSRFDLVGDGGSVCGFAAPEIAHKDLWIKSADKDNRNHKDQKRNQLGDGRNYIQSGGFLYAAEYQPVQKPDDDGGADDGKQVVAVAENREEMPECAEEQRCVGNIAKQRTEPIAPRRVKADEFTEAFLCVAVNAVGKVGADFVQPEEAHHQTEHAHAADCPADEHAARVSAEGRHVACGCENSAADGRADNHGGQFGERQGLIAALRS